MAMAPMTSEGTAAPCPGADADEREHPEDGEAQPQGRAPHPRGVPRGLDRRQNRPSAPRTRAAGASGARPSARARPPVPARGRARRARAASARPRCFEARRRPARRGSPRRAAARASPVPSITAGSAFRARTALWGSASGGTVAALVGASPSAVGRARGMVVRPSAPGGLPPEGAEGRVGLGEGEARGEGAGEFSHTRKAVGVDSQGGLVHVAPTGDFNLNGVNPLARLPIMRRGEATPIGIVVAAPVQPWRRPWASTRSITTPAALVLPRVPGTRSAR